ncbi:MAG TPA: hypothetical protein VGR31_03920 [Planctomycetota bacterium]|nr:hypothetical protein [Planctomycetota bacterium]
MELPAASSIAATFVVSVWVGMLVWAGRFIAARAPLFPILDDKSAWRTVLPPLGKLTWANLWEQHNGHRIPLPRFIYYCLYELTGDLHAGLCLQLEVLGLVSLAMILLARHLRGSTSYADAFFPLAWLHTGNAVNLLSGFQLALTLPTALACAILCAIAVSPRLPRPRRALVCGVSLAALPLCGGAGMIQVPALAAWVAWTGWRGRRSADPAERRGSRILLLSLLACAAFAAIHAWGYARTPGKAYGAPLSTELAMGSAMLALGFGPQAQGFWPASGVVALAFVASAVGVIWIALHRCGPRESGRALGLLLSMTATLCVVGAVVISRSDVDWRDGFPLRYVTLTTPLLCSVFFAWQIYGSRTGRSLVPGALALIALLALPGNARIGEARGDEIHGHVEEFEREIVDGKGPADLLRDFSSRFRGDPGLNLALLRSLAARHRPPFDQGHAVSPITFDFPSFGRCPTRVEPEGAVSAQFVARAPLTRVGTGTRIHLELLPGDTTVSGRFGIPRESIAPGRSAGVRVCVELVPSEGPASTLLDRTLRPDTVESDRDLQTFALSLPAHATSELVLRTENLDENGSEPSWVFWSDVAIE